MSTNINFVNLFFIVLALVLIYYLIQKPNISYYENDLKSLEPVDCTGSNFAQIQCRSNVFDKNPPNECLGPQCKCKLSGGVECGTYQGENFFCTPQDLGDIFNNEGVCL